MRNQPTMKGKIMSKELFLKGFENIKREGADKLLKFLEREECDFFKAPASTRFHLSCEGGLCTHSVHVFERLKILCANEPTTNFNTVPTDETIAICGLLHDLCKTNFYEASTRNVKKDGVWVQEPYYSVNDKLCYGHGEGSVYIINGFMKLTREEALAIRWHMGGFDEAVKGGSYSQANAWNNYPLGALLHCADLQATYLDERELEK